MLNAEVNAELPPSTFSSERHHLNSLQHSASAFECSRTVTAVFIHGAAG